MTPLPPARRPASPNRRARAGNVVRGLILLGTGRAEGFNCFDDGRDAFLSSLTPPLAFLVVMGAQLLVQKPSLVTLCVLLLSLCGILLPPVLSHLMATLWKRTDRWQRYATAAAWSAWLVLPAYLPAMLVASLLLMVGVGQAAASAVLPLLLGSYVLWLQWFLAWKGLQITRLRAALTVVVVVVMLSAAMTVILTQLLPLLGLPGSQAGG